MKFENEITVEVDMNSDELKKLLIQKNYKVMEVFDIHDIYLGNKEKMTKNYLEMLKSCILLRNCTKFGKNCNLITHKYKEFDANGDIIKQRKIECEVNSLEEATNLFTSLGYEEIIRIENHSTVFSDGTDEFVVQEVNEKHLYIELEEDCYHINTHYNSIDEMKKVIDKLNIKVKDGAYFRKKAEIELREKYGDE